MKLKIFSGRSNVKLAENICRFAGCALGAVETKNHNDGETYVRFREEVRGCDVFIVQSTNQPDSNLRELFLMVHAAKHASAGRVTAVIPYFGYARQDRKARSREPVPAAMDAGLLKHAGVDRVLLMDVHSSVVGGAFFAVNVITDTVRASPIFIRFLKERGLMEDAANVVIAAPDTGATNLARAYAKNLSADTNDLPIAIIDKRRTAPGEADVMNVVGADLVRESNVLLVDDMIDSGKTTVNAAIALKNAGAKRIYALATHAVLSGGAAERLEESCVEEVFFTDSIRHGKLPGNVSVVSVAELIGQAISRINTNSSISNLLNVSHWLE